jgi:ADP-ribose pyrophosphatase
VNDRPAEDKPLPRVVSSRAVYEGRVVSLRVEEIALPNGRTAIREVVEHPGAVVVAAVDASGDVILVRQYRHPLRGYLLELPAGGLEPGEDATDAAKRELREEVGLEATTWTPLGCFYSSPGFANERLEAFLATGLREVDADPDEDEDIEVVRLPLADLLDHPDRVCDAKTLATLLRVQRHLARS